MSRKSSALVVGIDHYEDGPLDSCVNDAEKIAELLRRNHDGTDNFTIVNTFTSSLDDGNRPRQNVSRDNIVQRLSDLFSSDAEDLLFYFAGHASSSARLGLELLVIDEEGRSEAGISMHQIAAAANQACDGSYGSRTVTIMLDCCFSGGVGNFVPTDSGEFNSVHLAKGAVLLSASSADQKARSNLGGHGFYTSTLIEGLEGAGTNSLGEATPFTLHSHSEAKLRDAAQTPVIKGYASTSCVLRRTPTGHGEIHD